MYITCGACGNPLWVGVTWECASVLCQLEMVHSMRESQHNAR